MRHALRHSLGPLLLLAVGCSDDTLMESVPLGPTSEPDAEELGLRLVPPGVELNLDGLTADQLAEVSLGSYLINGAAGCGCHVSEAGYLAGGVEFELPFLPPDADGNTSFFSRNLTPDPDTGMDLTAEEFIAAMRTGKDFFDSEATGVEQRLVIMPTHTYRHAVEQDLRAMYAYLQALPPVHNEFRRSYGFVGGPPVPAPQYASTTPAERGLEIPRRFSSGPAADAFADHIDAAVADLSADERARVGRGSYLVNALSDCSNCHTDGAGDDGRFDGGMLPMSLDINTETYLAGGVNLGFFLGQPTPVFTRNLTPDPETGLQLDEAEFIQVLRFGADFRRPGGSLRMEPHFPAEFRMTLEDIRSIYAYLRILPPVSKAIEIFELGG